MILLQFYSKMSLVLIIVGGLFLISVCSADFSGSVVGWGDNRHTQSSFPDSGSGIIAIDVGYGHNAALRADGSVICWGENIPNVEYYKGACDVPEPNRDFIAVAAGGDQTLGLKSNGSLVCWGAANVNSDIRTIPNPNQDFIAIDAGGTFNVGLKKDGSIVTWGSMFMDSPPPGNNFTAVAAGYDYCVALTDDGKIFTWGRGEDVKNNVPSPNKDFIAIGAGNDWGMGLKNDGSILVWGTNKDDIRNVPEPNSNFIKIATGYNRCLALRDTGEIVQWGSNYGNAKWNLDPIPEPNENFVFISAGGYQTNFGIKNDGTIVGWGDNKDGQSLVPTKNEDFIEVTAGSYYSCGLREDGSVYCWGDDYNHLWGAMSQLTVPEPNQDFISISSKDTHAIGLKNDGSVVLWGNNQEYQSEEPSINQDFVAVSASNLFSLGLKKDGTIEYIGSYNLHPELKEIPEPNNDFAAIAAGTKHCLGLKKNGSVVAWGDNYYYQCSVPNPNEDYIAIAVGNDHSVGLKNNGEIVCWGSNMEGQCDVPEPNTDFVKIAANSKFTMGLKRNGEVVVWGSVDTNIPQPNINYIDIAAGGYHCLAIRGENNVPIISITSINPTSTIVGSDNFTLEVTGSNFTDGAKVLWNGKECPTEFVSSTKLTAIILKEDISNEGVFKVKVVNPDETGSNEVNFEVSSSSELLPPPSPFSPGDPISPGLLIDTLTPQFNWTGVSGADEYGLYIRDMDTDTLIFDSRRDAYTITGNNFTLPSGILQTETSYRWNMNSHSSAGWNDDLVSGYSQKLYFTTSSDTQPEIDPALIEAIQNERIYSEDIIVTVDDEQYIIATLQNMIDPETFEIIPNSGRATVYLNMAGAPVSDGYIAQKIGLIEDARSIDFDFNTRITQLQLYDAGSMGVDKLIMTKGIIGKISTYEEGFQSSKMYWDWYNDEMWQVGITDQQRLLEAAKKFPTESILVDLAAFAIEKSCGNPYEEAKEDTHEYLARSIENYEKAALINNKEINDDASAFSYLYNVYYGRHFDEVSYYLLTNIYRNAEVYIIEFEPISGALSSKIPLMSLFKFPKLVEKAFLGLDWQLDTGMLDITGTYETNADLEYKLSEAAEYSLQLASAEQEISHYKIKHMEKVAEGSQLASEAADATVDYLMGVDIFHFLWEINAKIESINIFSIFSPGEPRIYDSTGRVTGLVNGEIREEIPESAYYTGDNTIVIFNATDSYTFKVVGTDEGEYGIDVMFIENQSLQDIKFRGINITNNSEHEYSFNWNMLATGGNGILLNKDLDGDGVYEESIITYKPHTPSNPVPQNSSTDISLSPELKWQGGDPDPQKDLIYSVYLGTNETPPLISILDPAPSSKENLSYSPTTLNSETKYYWYVTVRDNHGITETSPLWHFITSTAPGSDPGISPPEAQFNSNITSGHAPLTVQFNDSSSGTVTSYSWDFGDGITSSEKNPVHTYTSSGKYNVTLTVTNSAGEDTIIKNDYIQIIPMIGGDTGYYLIHCNIDGAEVSFDQDFKGIITDGTLLVKIYLTATPYHRYSVSKAGYVTVNEALPSYPAKDQTKDIFVTMVKGTDDSWTRPPYPEVTRIQPGYPDTNWTRPPYPEVTRIQPGYPDANWTRPPYPEVTRIQPGYPDTNWTRPPYPEVTKIQPGYPDTNWTRPSYLDWLWNRPSIKNFLKDLFG